MREIIDILKILSEDKRLRILMVRLLIISLFLSSIVIPAWAEPQMNLKNAVLTAFENNNEFRASKYVLSSKNKDIAIERSELFPKLKFEEVFTSTNNPTEALAFKLNQEKLIADDLLLNNLNHPAPINNFMTAIIFEQPLLDRKANIGIGIAKTDFAKQNFDYLRKQEEIASKVALAYFDVDRDQKIVDAVQKNLEEAQEDLNAVQYRYNKNTAFYSAVLRASTALTETKQMLVKANKNLEVSKRALGLVLGTQESVNIVKHDLPDFSLKEEKYYNNASLNRNDLKSVELKYVNAKNDVKLAEADYFPAMGIASAYRLYDHRAPFALEGHNYSASFYFRWDAFDGLKRRNEKSKAQDKMGEAYENLEGYKKNISFQVFSEYIGVEESIKNLRLSLDELKTAEEGRIIVLTKYKNSLLQLVDLLDVQNNLNQARSNSISQENNYIDSLINLSFASGTILKDLGIE